MTSLRPSGFDELGLRRALADRMLPLLVAAMAFLAALALAGWFGSEALGRNWREGAGAALTVQVSDAETLSVPGGNAVSASRVGGEGGTRVAAVLAVLTGTPGIASAHALTRQELSDLLKPWLGTAGSADLAIPMPAVIAVRLVNAEFDIGPLTRRLQAVAPGTLVEDHVVWISRLTVLARSLQACAALALVLVAAVAASVIAIATRAGLATRREAIEIVHGLGAADSYIAGRFAARATILAASGAAAGGLVALPILLALASLAEPFASSSAIGGRTIPDTLASLPVALWLALPCLPAVAAAIGFITAQGTVRRWLRRLP